MWKKKKDCLLTTFGVDTSNLGRGMCFGAESYIYQRPYQPFFRIIYGDFCRGGEAFPVALRAVEDRSGKKRQRLREVEKQLREKERIAAGRRRVSDEVQKLRNKMEQIQAKIDAFDEENRSGSEPQRLELMKKIFKKILNRLKKSSLKGDSTVQIRRTLRSE